MKRAERTELQALLKRRGYSIGKVDGKIGSKTRRAIRHFQASMGMIPDGHAGKYLLKGLRGAS